MNFMAILDIVAGCCLIGTAAIVAVRGDWGVTLSLLGGAMAFFRMSTNETI